MGLKENFSLKVLKVVESPPSLVQRAYNDANRISAHFNRISNQTFANGLAVRQHHTPSGKTVDLEICVRAGGDSDPPDKKGLAHALEHMLFRSPHLQPLAEEFERRGGLMNAATNNESTSYRFTIPKGAENERLMMNLASNMLFTPQFDGRELEEEREVIENEMDFRKDINSSIETYDALNRTAFGLEEREDPAQLIGSPDSLGNITVHDLGYFHYQHYFPANMTMQMTGNLSNFESSKTRFRQLAEFFGSQPDRRPPPLTEKPPEYEGGHHHMEAGGNDLSQTHISAAFDMAGDDGPIACEAQNVLRRYMDLSVKNALRGQQDRKVYFADVHQQNYHGRNLLVLSSAIKPENAGAVLPAYSKILREIAAGDINPQRFETAVAQVETFKLKGEENRRNNFMTSLDRARERLSTWLRGGVKPEYLTALVNERMLSRPPTLVTAGNVESVQSYDDFHRMLPVPARLEAAAVSSPVPVAGNNGRPQQAVKPLLT